MSEDDRITYERRVPVRPRVERFTVALDAEASALLRVSAADWGLTQAQTIALALRVFHATSAATAKSVRIDANGQARIADAVARATALTDRPSLDPRIHGHTAAGGAG